MQNAGLPTSKIKIREIWKKNPGEMKKIWEILHRLTRQARGAMKSYFALYMIVFKQVMQGNCRFIDFVYLVFLFFFKSLVFSHNRHESALVWKWKLFGTCSVHVYRAAYHYQTLKCTFHLPNYMYRFEPVSGFPSVVSNFYHSYRESRKSTKIKPNLTQKVNEDLILLKQY